MTKFMNIFLLPILVLALVACRTEVPSVNKPTAPAPAVGKAVMTGQVLIKVDGKPIPIGTPVRLAQIYRQGNEGAFVLDISHSPGELSIANGFFTIVNIPPAEYLLVVGEPDKNNYIILQGQDGKPASFQIQAGKVIDIGTVKVDYNP